MDANGNDRFRVKRARRGRAAVRCESGTALSGLLAVLALAAAVTFAALIVLGGGGGHRYKLLFQTGGQLVPGNQVLVGGLPIGTIDDVSLTDDGIAEIDVTLDQPATAGTTATVRLTSLSGIANRYVSLQMGPDNAEPIPDGGVIEPTSTSSPVDLDQLFDTFNARTRRSLKQVFAGQATVYGGAERAANRTYRFLAPGLQGTRRVLAELNADQNTFAQFLTTGSSVLGAVAERRDDLSALTQNANGALSAIADESNALDRSLAALPPAMRQGNTTFVNLRAALDDLDPLVAASKPATRHLAPFLRRLRPVARRAVPVVADLTSVVSRPGRSNDLADALGELPHANRNAQAAVPRAIAALDATQDDVDFARPYAPDLLSWVTKLAEITSYYDADGHYARIQPAGANLFSYNSGTEQLDPIPPAQQFAAYPAFGTGPFSRCPGAATQALAGSNPFLDDGRLAGDCDPTDLIPGP